MQQETIRRLRFHEITMTNTVIAVFVYRKGVSVEGYQSKVMDDNNIGQVYWNVQREMWEWLPPAVPPAGIVDITIYYSQAN